MDNGTLLEVLTASGVLTAISETIRWYLGRGKTRVDSAQVVQGMALDLLKPLHEEVNRCNKEITDLRGKVREVSDDLDAVVQWALTARSILDANTLPYPALPAPLRVVQDSA